MTMILPESQRCDSGIFFEQINKVCRIVDAYGRAYFVNRQIGKAKQMLCLGDTHLCEILDRSVTDILGKIPA